MIENEGSYRHEHTPHDRHVESGNDEKDKKSLFKNSIYLMMNGGLTSFLGFVFWFVATRLYEADMIGISAALINIATLISFFATLGINIGLLRFIPQMSTDQRKAVINSSVTFTAITSFILASLFAIISNIYEPTYFSSSTMVDIIFLFPLFVVVWSVNLLINSLLIAKKKSNLVLIKDGGVFSIVKILALIPLVSYVGSGIFLSWGLGMSLAVLVSGFWFIPILFDSHKYRFSRINTELKQIFSFSIKNYFGEILRVAPTLVLPILAVEMISPAEGGYFYIAWMIVNVLFIMGYMATLPLVSERTMDTTHFWENAKKTRNIFALVLLPATVCLIIFSGMVLEFIGGDGDYQSASDLLRLLCISFPFFYINSILAAKSRVQKDNNVLFIFGVSSVIAIAASIILFPINGINGGGYGWLIGQVVVSIIFGVKEIITVLEARFKTDI